MGIIDLSTVYVLRVGVSTHLQSGGAHLRVLFLSVMCCEHDPQHKCNYSYLAKGRLDTVSKDYIHECALSTIVRDLFNHTPVGGYSLGAYSLWSYSSIYGF